MSLASHSALATAAGVDPWELLDQWTAKRFTPDPMSGNNPESSDFGAMHFSVEGSSGHSQYYSGRSESLQNMARIADGDYAAVNTVPAPDHRGGALLPGDLLATLLTPEYTVENVVDELLDGDPGDAVDAAVDGVERQSKNLINTGEDVVDTIKSLF